MFNYNLDTIYANQSRAFSRTRQRCATGYKHRPKSNRHQDRELAGIVRFSNEILVPDISQGCCRKDPLFFTIIEPDPIDLIVLDCKNSSTKILPFFVQNVCHANWLKVF